MQEVYSVSAITTYLKEGMEGDPILSNLWIRGEVNNFYHHTSGHMYFTLKDSQAKIRAVMFRSSSKRLSFTLKDGIEVIASGSVSIYPPRGEYQLYVTDMKPQGIGDLYLAFEECKRRLEEEGLFQEERKRPLPSYPSQIGIITSLSGAALRDILSVLKRRFHGLSIIIAPARMQGEGTAESVMEALKALERMGGLDLIIISRGGGSWEELWPFNDEVLARQVSSSPYPIISAIGHEIDHTILDLVADLRAPTPSAAAELAVSTHVEIRERITSLSNSLYQGLRQRIHEYERHLQALLMRPVLRRPTRTIFEYHQRVDDLELRLQRLAVSRVQLLEERLRDRVRLLEGLNPTEVLARGYAVVEDRGRTIESNEDIEIGDVVKVTLKRGYFMAEVIDKSGEDEEDLS